MRRHHLLAIAAVSILALAGCSNSNNQASTDSTPSTAEGSATANPASNVQTENGTTSAKPGFSGLQAVVSTTEADVKAGNYAKAKADFSKFEDNWKPVEDGVKAKASKTYGEIEDTSDKISSELHAAKPDKQKLLTQLQSLNKNISTVAK